MADFIGVWIVASVFIFFIFFWDDEKSWSYIFAASILWPVVLVMKLWAGLQEIWEDIK